MTAGRDAFDVSVVVPAYQSALWIEETLRAIQAQTCAAREIIVVDDGSTDATAQIAESLGAVVLRQDNRGPSAARNAGIRRAAGRWIAFCDADDVWEPRMLERHAQAYRLCPDAVLSFSDGLEFDAGGTLRRRVTCTHPAYRAVRRHRLAPGIVRLDAATMASGFYRSNFILTPAVVAPRAAILDAGGFDDGLRVAEDYDVLLRLLARGTAVAIEDELVRVRKHGANITRDETVNSSWHGAFWERIAAAPERYPAGADRFVRDDRVRRLRKSGEFAVRVGRFAEARGYLADALRRRPSPGSAGLYVLAWACDNPLGRRLHAALRARWRAGTLRYARPGPPRPGA